MDWSSKPKVQVIAEQADANASEGVARVIELDQHLRTVAPGKVIELAGKRYRQGETVTLSARDADIMEAAGGVVSMSARRPTDLRSVRREEVAVGRITELDR